MTRFLCAAALLGVLVLASSPVSADENKKGKGRGKGRVNIEALFKKLDTNKDGKLSKDEFLKLAEIVKNRRGEEAGDKAKTFLDRLFDKLDTNSDGFLSLEEFRKLPELRKKLAERRKQKENK